MGQMLALIGRACLPTTPRHFWVIFEKIICSAKHDQTHGNTHSRKTIFLLLPLILLIRKTTENVYRFNSDFDGPMTSLSSIWNPLVKTRKTVINGFPPSPFLHPISPHPTLYLGMGWLGWIGSTLRRIGFFYMDLFNNYLLGDVRFVLPTWVKYRP